MDKYEQLGVVGEGSYGVVMKCKHKETGQLVAIKKFLETEEDAAIKRMALREIKMLKKLRHENLVSLLAVFRRRRRFYMVFEYVEKTVLEELEAAGGGLPDDVVRRHVFQLLRALEHCHTNNIIHRDVKPENVLVSRLGVIKLCDFGFARSTSQSGEPYTEYVATRWYRAPELLISDPKYGPEVDIWAVGCLFAEMMTGDPLFPGESDIDQLYLIVKLIGKLSTRQQQLVSRRPSMRGVLAEGNSNGTGSGDGYGPGRSLRRLLPSRRAPALALLASMLRPEPARRPPCRELLRHVYFTHDGFADVFPTELRRRAQQEVQANPLLRRWQGISAGRIRREGVNNENVPKESIPEPTLPPSLIVNENIIMNKPHPNSKTNNNKNINSADLTSSEKHPNPPPSPVDIPSSPLLNPTQTKKLPQPSPHKNINRSILHVPINAFPPPTHYNHKGNANKRLENRSEIFLIEEMKPHKGWEAAQPLKSKSLRSNNDLTLPSVPGATLSPLKSSKIKLLPLENALNIPTFRRDINSNSPGNRLTPTSLPYM